MKSNRAIETPPSDVGELITELVLYTPQTSDVVQAEGLLRNAVARLSADLEAANRERERLQTELDAIDEENVALVQRSIPRVRDAIETALQQVVHAYSTDIENALSSYRRSPEPENGNG